MTGTVIAWERDRGYGFLRVAGQPRNVFLHYTECAGASHAPPEIGDLVECEVIEATRGPRAVEARIVKRAALT